MSFSFYKAVFFMTLLYLWVGGALCAQSAQLHFRQFTTEDGLPSSETYVVFEDHEGYIWIGTDNGVARYDGYEFEVFDSNDGLNDVVVFTLLADDSGRIWAGTYSGDVYYFENGRFHAFAYNDLLQKTRKNNEFVHLIDVRDTSNVVIRLQRSGLRSIDELGEIRSLEIGELDGLSFYTASCFGPEASKLASITRNYPTNLLEASDYSNKNYPIYVGNEDCYREIGSMDLLMSGHSLWPIKNLAILPGAEEDKLLFFTSNKVFITGSSLVPKEIHQLEVRANYILPVSESSFWAGMEKGQGMQRINLDSNNNVATVDTFLHGRSISCLKPDSNQGLWVTTTDDGVYYCPFPEQQKYLINKKSTPLSVAPTGENNFYVGYADGTLYQFDGENNCAVSLDVKAAFGGRHDFLMFDSLSNTLFTSHIMLTHEPKVRPGQKSRIYSVYYAKGRNSFRGVDLISTCNRLGPRKGLCANRIQFGVLDLDTREVEFISKKRIEHFYGIETFLIDSLNQYLLGTLNGLVGYDPSRPDATPISKNLGAPELSTRVVKILEHKGGLLFATRGEGIVFLRDGNKTVLKEKDGLASDMIRDFEIADNGDVWVATLAGLSKVIYHDKGAEVRTYREEDGLINNEVVDVSIYGEQVWLATNSGIQKFQEIPPAAYSAPPIISRFTVDAATINNRKEVSISSGNHNVEIYFGTINYRLEDKVLYRYRLGTNDDWRFTRERNVTFPRLGSGQFAFAVASQNEAGVWSVPTEISFSIATPWYATWWARIFGFLLIMGAITWYFLRREKNRKRENEFLLQISRLEHEALHAQMNPHFVFNALNSIQNFVVHNDTKQAATYLSRFALVVRQTLNSSVNGQQTLAQEINMLETYLSLEKLRFKEAFLYEIILAPGLPLEDIALPPLLIQPFVENAILHGLKEIDEGGLIKISFSGNIQLLKVEIEDNGTGFETDQEPGEESMGMSITRRRLAMMKGGNRESSGMKVEPIYDTEGNLHGTKVMLWIYLEKFLANKDQLNPKDN